MTKITLKYDLTWRQCCRLCLVPSIYQLVAFRIPAVQCCGVAIIEMSYDYYDGKFSLGGFLDVRFHFHNQHRRLRSVIEYKISTFFERWYRRTPQREGMTKLSGTGHAWTQTPISARFASVPINNCITNNIVGDFSIKHQQQ